jgi:hypothetical protein
LTIGRRIVSTGFCVPCTVAVSSAPVTVRHQPCRDGAEGGQVGAELLPSRGAQPKRMMCGGDHDGPPRSRPA